MTILVNCGECGKGYRFDDDQAGRMVPCKNCGWDIDIPHRRRPSREGPRPQPRHRSERRPSQAIATQSDEDDEFLDERKSWYQSPVILIGGGIGAAVMLLFVVLIFAVFSRRNKPPVVADNDAVPNQQRQRQPIPERPVAPDRPRFNRPGPPRQGRQPFDQLRPNRVQEPPDRAEIVWNVRPDPLPEPITYIQEGISIPVEVRQASLIYPPTPSAFVGIGAIPRDFQIWDLRTIEQTGSIKIEETVQKQTLSPNGKYLVTERFTRDRSVVMELWSTEDATKIRDIPLVTSLHAFRLVLFVGPSRLLVCQSNGLFATKVTTIDVETGEIEKQGEMALNFGFLQKSYAISPNGRYMVWHDQKGNTIKVIELSVGSIVGNTRLPSIDQGLNAPDCKALAFSDDGKELAALFKYRSSFRLVSWSVETGQVSNVVDLEGRDPTFRNQLYSTDRPFRLQILSDQVGWLLYGTTLVDRKTGTASRVLKDPRSGLRPPVCVIGGRRVLRMSDDSKQVKSITISLEGIAKAESTGGDFGLSPLTAANRDTVKNIDLTAKKATWAVKPDPLPKSKKRITSKPIALPLGKFHEVEFSLAEGARMAAMTSTHPDDTDRSRRYSARDAKDRRFHLSIHNLIRGSQTRSIDVPSNSKLLAVSPSGKFAAVRAAGDGNRLDVWSLDDGQHKFAWNPYVANLALTPTGFSAIPPKPYAVHSVQFVDDEHVLTRDSGNSVNGKTECNYVMWKIPECTAIYKITRIERDFRFGTARLTPGREYLVISEGNGFHFLDSRSGELRGTLEFPPNCPGSIGRFAIHPNGKRFLATMIRRNGTSRSERVVTAWDLEQSNILLQFRTPISIAVGNLNWIPTSSHLVLAGYHLLDLDRCAVIWTYNASYWQGPTSAPDDRKWITVEGIGMSGPQLSWVRPVELRHAAAEQLAARKMPNGPITVVGPGSKITLQIGSMPGTDADFAQKVRELLTKRLKENGITVAAGQPVVLRTEMTSSGSKSMVFELTEETRFNVGRSTGKKINYSATKYDLRISIANSEGVVWEQKKSHYDFPSGGTIPKGKDPVSHLREQAAKGLKSAIERFFLNFAPPAIIYYQPKIGEQLGLGTSVIDTRVVQEISLAGLPPGVKPMHLKQPKPPKGPRFPSKSVIEPRLSDEFARPCRAYVNKVYADLLGRDESTWKTTLKWCEALKRPVVGLRWGFGVQFSGTKPSKAFVDPKPTTTELEKSLKALTAGVGPKLIDHLKLKSRNKEFGTWPTSGDPRVKQPVLLGGGSRQELLDGANGVGLDFIVVASFAPAGTGKRRETSMMIRVLDVDSGKQLFGSVRHKGSQLQDPTKNLGDAVVAEVIKWIDENLSLQEISDKSVQSVVSDRLDTIKRSNHPRIPMAVLAEVRMYQHMHKISAKKASGYYAQFLPQPDAEILANGTAEERRAVLEKAAPQIVK